MNCDKCRDGYCPACDTNFLAEIVRLENTLETHDRLNRAEIERLKRYREAQDEIEDRLRTEIERLREAVNGWEHRHAQVREALGLSKVAGDWNQTLRFLTQGAIDKIERLQADVITAGRNRMEALDRAEEAERARDEARATLREIIDYEPPTHTVPEGFNFGCEECERIRKRNWPPSGLCEDHYRMVSRSSDENKSEIHRMGYVLKRIAARKGEGDDGQG